MLDHDNFYFQPTPPGFIYEDEDEMAMTALRFHYRHTPEGQKFMDDRRAELLTADRAFKDEVLSSPEGSDMVKEKLAEAQERFKQANEHLEELKTMNITHGEAQDWFWSDLVAKAEISVKRAKSSLWRWRSLDDWNGGMEGLSPTDAQVNTGFDLEQLRQVPIDNVIGYAPSIRTDARWTYRCPVHSEKTGSFVWYRQQNSWHCYGCGAGGDVISLVMKINEITFAEACRLLTSF